MFQHISDCSQRRGEEGRYRIDRKKTKPKGPHTAPTDTSVILVCVKIYLSVFPFDVRGEFGS